MNNTDKILKLIKQKKTKQARIIVEENLKGNLSLYYYYKALCCCSEECFSAAIFYFKLSRLYGLDDYLLYYNLGVAYMELNDYEHAKDCFKTSIDLNRKFSKSYINLACVYSRNGDMKIAYRTIKTAMAYSNCIELEHIEKKLNVLLGIQNL
jgi:tetratricopeptide (TPR) repeat protein